MTDEKTNEQTETDESAPAWGDGAWGDPALYAEHEAPVGEDAQ